MDATKNPSRRHIPFSVNIFYGRQKKSGKGCSDNMIRINHNSMKYKKVSKVITKRLKSVAERCNRNLIVDADASGARHRSIHDAYTKKLWALDAKPINLPL